ncbi:MAG: hypothetical protein AAF378_18455 [Cyanobacteria bacterium P01_A01_bin.84]
MKTQINTKNSTLIVTIAGLIFAGTSIFSFVKADNESSKNLALNSTVLSLGLVAGSLTASALMSSKVDEESKNIQEKFTNELNTITKSKEKLEDTTNKQVKIISQRESKIFDLEKLIAEKDLLIQQLKTAFSNLQLEFTAKHKELDAKLARENNERKELYKLLIKEFVSDLKYKVETGYNRLADSLEHKLTSEKYQDIHTILLNFRTKLFESCKRSNQWLWELQELQHTDKITSDITEIYFQISDEIAAHKVQYRNLLNTTVKLTMQEFEQELKIRRDPKQFVAREKVLTGLDVIEQQYSESKNKFLSAIQGEIKNLDNLRDNVTNLIDEIDNKNIEIAKLKTEINEHRKPLKWLLAQSRELQIGNLIIDFFWKQGYGYYLDRSFHETDGYDCKLYFQIDRNPRQVVESELNEHSEALQQYCNVLKPVAFKYSGAKGLMVASVSLREKPKTDGVSDISRICKPHKVFKASLSSYERWRVTGGSQAGKSPTAQFIADAITAYSSKEVKVRLFNPQHGSKKDNWKYRAEGKNAEECLKGFSTLNDEIKNRQSKKRSTDTFDLFIFDELDSVIEELGSTKVRPSLLYAVKQASHQDVGIIIIGQSSAANVVSKMTWSDWNSTAQCHIGENAKLFIENRWKNEPEQRDEYLKQYATIRDFYQRKNDELGLTISDYGYFRFAFIAIPNQKPYFIELPPFIFHQDDEPQTVKPQQSIPDVEVSTTVNCKHCKSTNTKAFGKAGRYKCGDCKRTFTPPKN